MTRSSRLLFQSVSRRKATQWKPRPLPPLPEAAVSSGGSPEANAKVAVQEVPEQRSHLPNVRDPKRGSYAQLQEWLIGVTLALSLAIAACVAVVYSWAVASNYLLGALVGVVYLRMLSRGVAELGKSRSRLGSTRLAVFAGLIIVAARVDSLQVLPIFLGFMTYKLTLLIHLVQTLTRSSSSA